MTARQPSSGLVEEASLNARKKKRAPASNRKVQRERPSISTALGVAELLSAT